MYKIVLLRHGESVWNQENRFTGWHDVGLTAKGMAEAQAAGQLLRREGYAFDLAFTSVLRRAIKTLWTVLEELDRMWIPVGHSWRLNERPYRQREQKSQPDGPLPVSKHAAHDPRRDHRGHVRETFQQPQRSDFRNPILPPAVRFKSAGVRTSLNA